MENRDNNPSEPCQICGDIGFKDLIMTCFHCREVREHIYCARICLQSVPDMWLCEVCRSSTRVLQLSNDTKALEIHKTANSDNNVEKEISKPLKTSNGGSKVHPPSHGLVLMAHSCPKQDKKASWVSNETSSNKKRQGPQFVAFPSPKRKRRTARFAEDTKEANHQGAQSTYPCVFHPI